MTKPTSKITIFIIFFLYICIRDVKKVNNQKLASEYVSNSSHKGQAIDLLHSWFWGRGKKECFYIIIIENCVLSVWWICHLWAVVNYCLSILSPVKCDVRLKVLRLKRNRSNLLGSFEKFFWYTGRKILHKIKINITKKDIYIEKNMK